MNQRRPAKSTQIRTTLQFSALKPILYKGQAGLFLRRKVTKRTASALRSGQLKLAGDLPPQFPIRDGKIIVISEDLFHAKSLKKL
jgi:hypothetical protein